MLTAARPGLSSVAAASLHDGDAKLEDQAAVLDKLLPLRNDVTLQLGAPRFIQFRRPGRERSAVDVLPEKLLRRREPKRLGVGPCLDVREAGVAQEVVDLNCVVQREHRTHEAGRIWAEVTRKRVLEDGKQLRRRTGHVDEYTPAGE
jgi:hypothetical protein